MEIIQIVAYGGLCIGWVATILSKKHESMNWEKAQGAMLDEHAKQTAGLKLEHKQEIVSLQEERKEAVNRAVKETVDFYEKEISEINGKWREERTSDERTFEKIISGLKNDHQDELAEMEASCQERERYEQSKYDQLNEAFINLQIKHDIVCGRNRKLRPGFNVQAVAKAVDKVKGVRVS